MLFPKFIAFFSGISMRSGICQANKCILQIKQVYSKRWLAFRYICGIFRVWHGKNIFVVHSREKSRKYSFYRTEFFTFKCLKIYGLFILSSWKKSWRSNYFRMQLFLKLTYKLCLKQKSHHILHMERQDGQWSVFSSKSLVFYRVKTKLKQGIMHSTCNL